MRASRSFGLLLVFALAACTAAVAPQRQPPPRVPAAVVLAAVRAAPSIHTLPAGLTPPLAATAQDVGFDSNRCETGFRPCVFGDPASAFLVLLYGDSRAGMWLPALSAIAERQHWRLRLYI